MKLILASSSPFRKKLLERLGLSFDVFSPQIDEDFWKKNLSPSSENATKLSQELAYQKALETQKNFPDARIIGSDQVGYCASSFLDKPLSKEKAEEQLAFLAEKTHELHTSFCLLEKNKKTIYTDTSFLTMKKLSKEKIKAYIEKDNPISCAGSYKLESLGISLFEKIETHDYTAIIGLPLLQLSKELKC